MTYSQSETYSHKMPQKLATTACFIQEESSGGLLLDETGCSGKIPLE